MKHLRSEGKYDTQLLAELVLDSAVREKINDKFFNMWKSMLKKDFKIDLEQVTLPQLIKELRVEINGVQVVLTGSYKIRVWKPTYTLITSLE